MSLSSLQLDAFLAVARAKGFSSAAKLLHVTQSALSQRILNLERELQTSLFVREPGGPRLTRAGERLLRVCLARGALEGEFLSGLRSRRGELSGHLRVAGFSTQVRSVLLPRVAAFSRRNQGVQIDLVTRETHELPALLASGQADLVVTDRPAERPDVVSYWLGDEEYVLVRARRGPVRENVFIDHDALDRTTADFWRAQKSQPPPYTRIFMDDIYTLIEAVEAGLGRAVVPLHLIRGNLRVSVTKGLKPLRSPVYLNHLRQAFYPQTQTALVEWLTKVATAPRRPKSALNG